MLTVIQYTLHSGMQFADRFCRLSIGSIEGTGEPVGGVQYLVTEHLRHVSQGITVTIS
jgi:hypothetical protein